MSRPKHVSLTIHGDDSATTLVVDINRALSPLEHMGLTTTFLQYLRNTIGDEIGAIRVGHPAEDAVIAAARLIERGCDCEYDYRCGRCQYVIDLRVALEALDKARTL